MKNPAHWVHGPLPCFYRQRVELHGLYGDAQGLVDLAVSREDPFEQLITPGVTRVPAHQRARQCLTALTLSGEVRIECVLIQPIELGCTIGVSAQRLTQAACERGIVDADGQPDSVP